MDFDAIINATQNNIASENHDKGNIAIDVDGFLKSQAAGLRWDTYETGISAEEIERRIAEADTPEKREQLRKQLAERANQRANLYQTTDGRIAVMVSEPSWHQLGFTMRGEFTADDIKNRCLDWTYEILPARDQRGDVIPKLRYIELVSADGKRTTLEGVGVGNRHTVVQPSDFVDWSAKLVGSIAGARFVAAGAVDDGKRIWTQARIPETLEPIRGDITELYLLATDVFDGSAQQEVITTAERAVCQNTCRLARSNGSAVFKNRHTSGIETRMSEYCDFTASLRKRWDQLREAAPAMVSRNVDVRGFAKPILDDCLGVTEALADHKHALEVSLAETEIERKRSILERRAKNADTVLGAILDIAESETNTAPGSVWGAFQSTTQYANHGIKYRGGKTSKNAFESLLMGGRADDINQRALESALELAS